MSIEEDEGAPGPEPRRIRVVVMGVSGSGKSTIARRLAERLDATFLEGDDFHPEANVAKMAAGHPLDDDDRRPWLTRLRDELEDRDRVVLACSALRRRYRDRLRDAGGVDFVLLDLDRATAVARVAGRSDHFMGPSMVASQFDTLEPPGPDEDDVVSVDGSAPIATVVAQSLAGLAGLAESGT